jgi:hypothetical protein
MSEFPVAAHRLSILRKNRVYLNVTDNGRKKRVDWLRVVGFIPAAARGFLLGSQ